ncbi:MAG: Crp/Fnr family transcriptional regulator [Myxococcaceae bacterium]
MASTYEGLKAHAIAGMAQASLLATLARSAELRRVEHGTVVVRALSALTEVLLILDGFIEVRARWPGARKTVLLETLEAHAVLGDTELVGSEERWSVSARSATDVTLVALPVAEFRKLLSDQSVALALYRSAAARLSLSRRVARIYAESKTRDQLLRLLWSSASERSTAAMVLCPPTSLGRALGVDRKTISRSLVELERLGLLRREGRFATLCGPPMEALRARDAACSWRLVEAGAPK